MTKLKSKKITKSTIAIIVMAVMLVALLAFGGTYAYFTATAKNISSSNLKTGYVHLSSTGSIAVTNVVFPGQEILTEAGVTVAPDTNDASGEYVACRVVASAEGITFTVDMADGWLETSEDSGIYVYATGSNATAMTVATKAIDSIKFDADDHWDGNKAADLEHNPGYKSDEELMGIDVTITIEFKSIQVTGNTDKNTVATVGALFTPAD